jgi:hypothetical protein
MKRTKETQSGPHMPRVQRKDTYPDTITEYSSQVSHLCCPPAALSFAAALPLDLGSPNPQPPSRSSAIIAPAHFPVLKPQHSDLQSTSPVQTPVMNCDPGAGLGGALGAAAPPAAGPPLNPQPPSRSTATTGPAHFPVLKPQHLDWQSASEVQAPVMNCVPWAAAKRETGRETDG